MAETRPQDFLGRYPPPVILDEIQYAPAFFRPIKAAVDAQRPSAVLIPIECKVGERPSARALHGIDKLREFYGEGNTGPGYVACTTTAPYALSSNVTAVSGWMPWPLGT